MRRRHKARRWTLQILYAWEVRGRERPLADEAAEFFARRQVGAETREHAERLVGLLARHMDEIDETLAGAAENWDLERMSIIDRNILRIAMAELRYVEDVPWKVAIDEAVTLASRYGGSESPRFVNGVLDSLAHKLNRIA